MPTPPATILAQAMDQQANEAPSEGRPTADPVGAPLSFRVRLGLGAALALLLLWAYRHVFSAELVYDDLLLIGRNARLTDLGTLFSSLLQPFWAFDDPEPTATVGYWRPLTTVVLAVCSWVSDRSPVFLHATSLSLHLGASLMTWRLLSRLTGRPWPAYLAAALFALHPVHVESVAWISAINDPLYALLGLAALDSFVRWRLAGSKGRPVASGVWLLAALLAKEQALAVIPVAWALDLALGERAGTGDGQSNESSRTSKWLRVFGPMLIAAVVYTGLRVWVFSSPLAGFDRQAASFQLGWARTATYWIELFGGFLSLLAWPVDLAVFRQVRPQLPPLDPRFIVAASALVIWALGTLWSWRRGSTKITAALLFLPASLAPVLLSFESAGAFPLSDRYLYLAVAGWTLLLTRLTFKSLNPRLATAAVAAVLVVYGVKTSDQTRIYKDDETFFRAAVEASPRTPYVHWGLGRVLLTRYQVELDKPLLDEALLHFLTSLYLGTDYGDNAPKLGPDASLRDRVSELNSVVNDTPREQRKQDLTVMWSLSDREQANIGLGWCYLFLADLPGDGDLSTPLYVFEQTVNLFPQSYRALTGLGAVHLRRGDTDAAIEAFRRALEIHGGATEAWHNLGQAHIRAKDWDRAQSAFEQALKFRPGHVKDLVGIATTAIEAGRFDKAEETLAELRDAAPESLEPLFWSGMLLARQRDFPRALSWFDAVVTREPGHGPAHLERGKLLLQLNETTEAIKALGRACELAPDSFEAHYNLGVLQLQRIGPEPAKRYLVRAFELSPRGELRDNLHSKLRELLNGEGVAASALARLSRKRDEPAKAHDWVTDAILAGEPWATSPGTHQLRGWALQRLGEREEAVGAYKRAVELAPEAFMTNHDLGMLLASMGRRQEALPYLEAAKANSDRAGVMDPSLLATMLRAVGHAIDGTLDFSGPTQIPIPAQGVDESWR